ncbi:hypothetical protein GMSM_29610 [Geomonas sp. Red276]
MNKTFFSDELAQIQYGYHDLVMHGFEVLNLNYFSHEKCLWFVDELCGFWLERKEILRHIWSRVVDDNDCFILSAALNLKIDKNNHYAFRAIGDYQVLHDPFLRLEGLLRAPYGAVNTEEVETQFRYIMQDTLSILREFPSDFHFINMELVWPSEEDKMEIINAGFDGFIKHLFEEDDSSVLPAKYPTYDLIEKRLLPWSRVVLHFNSSDDADISLGERVEAFVRVQRAVSDKVTAGNEYNRFVLALFCMFSQAMDPILSCLSSGLYPFYRGDVPVRYFYLLMQNFIDNEGFIDFIAKTNAAYFLANGIDRLSVNNVSFEDYSKYIDEKQPYSKLLETLRCGHSGVMRYKPSDISEAVKPILEMIQSDLNLS